MPRLKQTKIKQPKAVDLFSGCGGLSLGLSRAGYDVIAAVEFDRLACETYRLNHRSTRLFESDIRQLSTTDLMNETNLDVGELDLLAGCPPCQGFSSIRTRNGGSVIHEPKNDLVFEFERFVLELMPKTIMMENVPGLASDARASKIIRKLESVGYSCKMDVFNAADFGAPQRRKRMILIGSLVGDPDFAQKKKRSRTVRGVIGRLPRPDESDDPLHNYKTNRSKEIERLIRMIPKDGGSRKELPENLQLECHKRCDGFKDVYGRMEWGKPSPTITGGCINPSKGRFLHPQQDRAITLREAAMLQGFPASYKFSLSRGRYPTAQMIGNAFPPVFAEKHAAALLAL